MKQRLCAVSWKVEMMLFSIKSEIQVFLLVSVFVIDYT